MTVWTVGHSTRPVEEFIALLRAHNIEQLVDVRTIPRSRHNPQYGQDQLEPALEAASIRYLLMPGLGGLRHAHRDSINSAWRNASFRGYADYMQTEAFIDALNELIGLARERRIAIMCAEAVPWRCHRSLVADALVVRGISAEEIASPTRTQLIEQRWIFDAVRHFTVPEAERVFVKAAEMRAAYPSIAGIGLGGDERRCASEPFRALYAQARQAGLRLTNHAGETTGPEAIWEALSIGSERIGHALSAGGDPALLDELRARGTALELNPTSNVRTGVCPSIGGEE